MNKLVFIFLIIISTSFYFCGESPELNIEVNPPTINLPSILTELLGDSAQVNIYDNGLPVANALLDEISVRKNSFLLTLPCGEHLIEVFITGPNHNVVYMLDRRKISLIPDMKNSLDINLASPIKFNTKSINLSPGGEIIVTASIDNSKLPEGLQNPELKWSIDNVENGNTEIGTITGNGNTVTIKAPTTLPSSENHYLGAYYEANGKKYISIVKITYSE